MAVGTETDDPDRVEVLIPMVELIDPDAEAEDPAVPEEVMLNWSDEAWKDHGKKQAGQLGADCKIKFNLHLRLQKHMAHRLDRA
jgi:hypothetical protein